MTSYLAALFALVAAVMFGFGDAIEHHVVSELRPDASARAGVMLRILRSPRWLLGLVLTVGAWGCFAAALALGSLLFVQPLVATGVLVALAVSARLTHARFGRRAWLMAVVLCAGLSVFLVEAAPDGGRSNAPIRSWLFIGGPFLLVTAVGVLASRWTGGHLRAAILGVSAGATLGITSALSKVSTDGNLFEMTIYNNITSLLNEQKGYVNMYEAFTQYRNEQITQDEREKMYNNLLGEKGSVFASHPTFAERAEAIKTLPAVVEADDRAALELFDQADALEQELTRFLTDYMSYLQYLQAQAAQQQS